MAPPGLCAGANVLGAKSSIRLGCRSGEPCLARGGAPSRPIYHVCAFCPFQCLAIIRCILGDVVVVLPPYSWSPQSQDNSGDGQPAHSTDNRIAYDSQAVLLHADSVRHIRTSANSSPPDWGAPSSRPSCFVSLLYYYQRPIISPSESPTTGSRWDSASIRVGEVPDTGPGPATWDLLLGKLELTSPHLHQQVLDVEHATLERSQAQ